MGFCGMSSYSSQCLIAGLLDIRQDWQRQKPRKYFSIVREICTFAINSTLIEYPHARNKISGKLERKGQSS